MHKQEKFQKTCFVVTSVSCVLTVRGHRHCKHHYQGHLPSQILPLQLFLQRSPTQSRFVGGQRVIIRFDWVQIIHVNSVFQKTDVQCKQNNNPVWLKLPWSCELSFSVSRCMVRTIVNNPLGGAVSRFTCFTCEDFQWSYPFSFSEMCKTQEEFCLLKILLNKITNPESYITLGGWKTRVSVLFILSSRVTSEHVELIKSQIQDSLNGGQMMATSDKQIKHHTAVLLPVQQQMLCILVSMVSIVCGNLTVRACL